MRIYRFMAITLAIVVSFQSLPAIAQGRLPATLRDARVRTEIYDPKRVYSVYTAIGKATLIQFEEGESLAVSSASVLGIGDAEAWNLGVRGNNIVLKPATRLPQTNLVVVTNRRTYSFDLIPAGKRPQTYIIRFFYPDTQAAMDEETLRRLGLLEAARAEKWVVNTNYIWKGKIDDTALVPTAAWDDGRFTRLVYDHSGELPVFYKVLPDGTESLLNYNVDPKERGTIVLHEVVRLVRVRLNARVIEIHNRGYKLPALNRTGTGEHGAVRIERNEKKPSGRKP
jgi:type IV secretion system protein VirB9